MSRAFLTIALAIALAFPATAQQLDHVTISLTVNEANVIFRALQSAPMPWQEVNPVIVKVQEQAKAQADAAAAAAKKAAEDAKAPPAEVKEGETKPAEK